MSYAYLFPGQGSQSVGMLSELADQYSEVKQTFEQASEILQEDLWKLACLGPEQELNRTENTQPLMLCASIAIWKIWRQQFPHHPSYMAGHSFGEYTALVCAESLDFESAVSLARYRGKVMQEAVPQGQGAMAAVLGLDDEKLIQICGEAANGQVVEAVNFNAPGQVVIAGDADAVNRAIVAAKAEGAKRAILLPLSVPSHSRLMQGAAEKLQNYLNDVKVQMPTATVLHNADVKAYKTAGEIKNVLYRQLFCPVRWVETIQAMIAQGVDTFIELGPGKVLTGLNKRIDRNVASFCIDDQKSLEQTLAHMAEYS